jgi:hypothetical protein
MRAAHAHIDLGRQLQIECDVSTYIRENFSFAVIQANDRAERLRLESRMISTVSLCEVCQPSPQWPGRYSPISKIRESGLWLVNGLYREPLSVFDLEQLARRAPAPMPIASSCC